MGQCLPDALLGLRREVLDVMVEVAFGRRVYRGVHRQDRRIFRLAADLARVMRRRQTADPWLLLLSQAAGPHLGRPSALVGKVA